MNLFPFGKAPALIAVAAVCSGLYLLAAGRTTTAARPDLVLMVFASNHVPGYERAAAAYKARTGRTVSVQLVDQRVVTPRLVAAMAAGSSDVPDLVELLSGSIGLFTRGPVGDVDLLDLTPRVEAAGLRGRVVESRFGAWTSRGRVYALPHDVHPVMLAYRRDLVEQLGIDVSRLTTWDAFAAEGRRVTTANRFMLDLNSDGADSLLILARQRDAGLFDAAGAVAFDSEVMAQTVAWHLRQVSAPVGGGRTAFPAGWGQGLSQAMTDGLVLFYFCPDWRTGNFEADVPALSGKLGLMPLPAWEAGGRRTSTWGGTGLAIPRTTRDPQLAWDFAMFLYYDTSTLGRRFEEVGILPPLREAWALPEMSAVRPYWGVALGRSFAELAPDAPPEYVNAYSTLAATKLREAYVDVRTWYVGGGNEGPELMTRVRAALKARADEVRAAIARDRFGGGAR